MNLVNWSILQSCLSLGEFHQTLPGEKNSKVFIVTTETGLYAWIEFLSDRNDEFAKPRIWIDFIKSGDNMFVVYESALYLDIVYDTNGNIEKASFSPQLVLYSDLTELINDRLGITSSHPSVTFLP